MLNTGVRQSATSAAHRSVRFYDVDPGSHATEAAALLRRSWAPPCLRYSDAYVRWQLAFPGDVPTRAVAAIDGSTMIGFVALIPRRIAGPTGLAAIYVMSFFAVHPDYRGARIGSELARRMVEISDRPIFTFTEPGAPSERANSRAAAERGWAFRNIATLRTYAGGTSTQSEPSVAVRQATVEEYLDATKMREPVSVAWSRPTREQARHYLADPRGACFVIAHAGNGEALGAALVIRSEVVTSDGADEIPSLDAVHLHRRHAAGLSALRRFALEHANGSAIVTAPNLDVIPASAIRQAGFRATRSAFNVGVLGDPAESITQSVAINLEVF